MNPLSVVLVLLAAASFPRSSSRAEHVLRTVRSDQIDGIVEHACLLVGIPPCSESLLTLLSTLSTAYNNDSTVYIALLEQNPNHVVKGIKWSKASQKSNQTGNIAFFRKKVADRSCLLTPPAVSYADPYPGPLSADALVTFLNEQCDGFRTMSGGTTPAGILHEQIMGNLYHIPEPVSKCARLKTLPTKEEFFWKYLTRSQPVVIEGAVRDWPAMKKWSMSHLEERFGEKEVHIKMTKDGCYEGVESASLWPGYSEEWIPEKVRKQLQFPDLVVVRPATPPSCRY